MSSLPEHLRRKTAHPMPSPQTMPAAPDRECALLARLARQDTPALAELYALYAGPLFSYAQRTLGSREDAEEALQDVFVKIWEKAPTYDPAKSRPYTWSFMLMRGNCWDRLRARGRRDARLLFISLEDAGESAGAHLPPSVSPDEWENILAAMKELTPQERQAIEMAVFLEVPHAEIAGRLQEPLGTVKSRVRRGLMRLRSLLKRHD